MPLLSFQQTDPSRNPFQFLEDLATAYWYSEILFTALELGLFGWIEKGANQPDTLAGAAGCRPAELARLMRVLETLGLVLRLKEKQIGDPDPSDILSDSVQWQNSEAARTFLCPDADEYMGDFLLYRRYMQPRWQELTRRVLQPDRPLPPSLSPSDDYEVRNRCYVRSTDRLMRRKATEIIAHLSEISLSGPVLDIGGGGGSMGRMLVRKQPDVHAVLFDLPEVIEAAHELYPDFRDWRQVLPVAGDFRFHPFREKSFGLVILSNFLHVYGPDSAPSLLRQAVQLLKPDGIILIHDFFPDRTTDKSPHKGALYDLNMMLNTYDGVCHETKEIIGWLEKMGVTRINVRDLKADTSVIIAGFSRN